MKTYFAGSIRGGEFPDKQAVYDCIMQQVVSRGHTLLTGVGLPTTLDDKGIFLRDMEWIQESDLFIAEITAPSLGVGYEIGVAEEHDIPILCLHHASVRPSAMIAGNDGAALVMADYASLDDIKEWIGDFCETWEAEFEEER